MYTDKRFVIIGPARTGSTMMRTMLNQLDGVVCHGEIFAPTRILGLSNKVNNDMSDQELLKLRRIREFEFLKKVKFTPNNVCGIKIIYHQLLSISGQNFLRTLLENEGIKIVHLWRKDLEARFYSETILKYKFNNKSKEKTPLNINHSCDAREIYSESERLINCGNLIQNLFINHDSLSLCYEDFLDKSSIRNELLNFLGIPQLSENKFSIPNKRLSFDNKEVNVILENKNIESAKFRDLRINLPAINFLS